MPPIAPGGKITFTLGGDLTEDVDRRRLSPGGQRLRREVSLARGIPIEEVIEIGITPPAYVSSGNVVIATHRARTNEDGFVEFTLDTAEPHHV